MAGIADWLDMMPRTVSVYPLTGRDAYGAPTYGPKSDYAARVNNKAHFIRGPEGETITARGTAWLATTDPISAKDKVILPDGSEAIILDVTPEDDEVAGLYTRLDLG